MAKDFKEKYEKICTIKDRAIGLVDAQINGNIENVNAKELGEVADIAKDMAEIVKLFSEAEYYHKITEAMDKNKDSENRMYMDKYLPETRYYEQQMRYMPFGNMWSNDYENRDLWKEMENNGVRYYGNDSSNSRGGGSNGGGGRRGYAQDGGGRDYREGRSGSTRRAYMEMAENGADQSSRQRGMEQYMYDLTDDITEMIQKMDVNEKNLLKQKISQLATKIV